MSKSSTHNRPFNRRKFISSTIKLAVLGSILPLEACNNKSSEKETKKPGTKRSNSKKTSRKKWHHESLVINSKSKVMHFPTSKVYTYYDEIIPKHLQVVPLATWTSQLQEPVRLNKEQSGNIIEVLAMQYLNRGITDENVTVAGDILTKAFTKECENSAGINSNTMNFRLHELMLQLVALNATIPPESKW